MLAGPFGTCRNDEDDFKVFSITRNRWFNGQVFLNVQMNLALVLPMRSINTKTLCKNKFKYFHQLHKSSPYNSIDFSLVLILLKFPFPRQMSGAIQRVAARPVFESLLAVEEYQHETEIFSLEDFLYERQRRFHEIQH